MENQSERSNHSENKSQYEENERQLEALKRSNAILEEKILCYETDIKLLEKERATHIAVNIGIMNEMDALKQELSKMNDQKCKQDRLINKADETKSAEIATLKDEIERLNNVIKSYTARVEREHDYFVK